MVSRSSGVGVGVGAGWELVETFTSAARDDINYTRPTTQANFTADSSSPGQDGTASTSETMSGMVDLPPFSAGVNFPVSLSLLGAGNGVVDVKFSMKYAVRVTVRCKPASYPSAHTAVGLHGCSRRSGGCGRAATSSGCPTACY